MLQGALNQLARQINEINHAKGWYDSSRTFGDITALFHEEIAEAFKAYRVGHGLTEVYYEYDEATKTHKPEGIPIELADEIIRILDFCYDKGIDIEAALLAKIEYNKQRPYRHGGRKV